MGGMTNTNTTTTERAALESLRSFAYAHGEMAFGHMVTAALNGEQWAIDRATPVAERFAADIKVIDRHTQATLQVVRATDATNPDGSTSRSIKVI